MKILSVQETDWLKRNPGQQHHLAELLSLRGHKIRVVDYEIAWKTQGKREFHSNRSVFNNVSKIYDQARIMVIRPGIIKIPGLDYISLVFSHRREIDRQIAEFAPDVIVGWDILNARLAMKAARRNRIPFVYYWNDVNHRLIPFKPFRPIGKWVENKTLRQADKILAINEKLTDYVIKLGAPPERTGILRAGINIDHFNPDIDGKTVRKSCGLNKDDIVLFFMGWLYNFSGLKEVALRLAQTQNPNLKLLIVGEGDAYKELQRIQQEYNLKDRLILTGKKPYSKIPSFIAAADVCLLPAYPREPIMQDIVPIKLYEYMAMKRPVISTRLPGVIKEFGKDNGVVYVDNPEDVIAKATQLLHNGKLEELGGRARSFAKRNSWDNITDEFERILEEAIKEKQREIVSK